METEEPACKWCGISPSYETQSADKIHDSVQLNGIRTYPRKASRFFLGVEARNLKNSQR